MESGEVWRCSACFLAWEAEFVEIGLFFLGFLWKGVGEEGVE
jgi:hypothetical protein